MTQHIWRFLSIFLLSSGLMGCAADRIFMEPMFTVTVYEDSNRVVRLQTTEVANEGEGFSHPAYLTDEKVAMVLRGLYVKIEEASVLHSLIGGDSSTRQRAFSDKEIEFFAPLFVKGLRQATPEEVVTFYETAEISDLYEVTTSGGVFVHGDEFHVLLSNFRVKTPVWQDNEQYQAPVRMRPLEPIDPQPGRLLFDPPRLMVQPEDGMLRKAFLAVPWEVGVRWKELGHGQTN